MNDMYFQFNGLNSRLNLTHVLRKKGANYVLASMIIDAIYVITHFALVIIALVSLVRNEKNITIIVVSLTAAVYGMWFLKELCNR